MFLADKLILLPQALAGSGQVTAGRPPWWGRRSAGSPTRTRGSTGCRSPSPPQTPSKPSRILWVDKRAGSGGYFTVLRSTGQDGGILKWAQLMWLSLLVSVISVGTLADNMREFLLVESAAMTVNEKGYWTVVLFDKIICIDKLFAIPWRFPKR